MTKENELTLQILEKVKDKVYSSYSGKTGCMCGCNGEYSYSKAHRHFSTRNRGYKVVDNEINDLAVTKMTNKFKKLLKTDAVVSVYIGEDEDCHLFYETKTRYNAIYFRWK